MQCKKTYLFILAERRLLWERGGPDVPSGSAESERRTEKKATYREQVKALARELGAQLAGKSALMQVGELRARYSEIDHAKIRGPRDAIRLQSILIKLGFDPKGVDGWVGDETRSALQAFKVSYNAIGLEPKLDENSEFDNDTLGAMQVYAERELQDEEQGWVERTFPDAEAGSHIRYILHGEDEKAEPEELEGTGHVFRAGEGLIRFTDHGGADIPVKPKLTPQEREAKEVAATLKRRRELASGKSVTIDARPIEDLEEEA